MIPGEVKVSRCVVILGDVKVSRYGVILGDVQVCKYWGVVGVARERACMIVSPEGAFVVQIF